MVIRQVDKKSLRYDLEILLNSVFVRRFDRGKSRCQEERVTRQTSVSREEGATSQKKYGAGFMYRREVNPSTERRQAEIISAEKLSNYLLPVLDDIINVGHQLLQLLKAMVHLSTWQSSALAGSHCGTLLVGFILCGDIATSTSASRHRSNKNDRVTERQLNRQSTLNDTYSRAVTPENFLPTP